MEQTNDRTFLETEPVGKLLLKLALPTVAAQLINMMYNIVDRMYIGHIPGDGAMALTGVGVCMPLIMVVSAFAALISNGGAPRREGQGGKNAGELFLHPDYCIADTDCISAGWKQRLSSGIWSQRKYNFFCC